MNITHNYKQFIALSIYLTALFAANTLGIKIMPLLNGHISVAIFWFPIVFLMTDVIGEVYGKEKVDENGNPIQKPGKAPNYGEKPMAAFIQHAQKNYPEAWQGDSTPADWIEQAKKMGLDPSVAYQKIEARMKAIQDQKNKQRGFLGNILHSLTKDPGAL